MQGVSFDTLLARAQALLWPRNEGRFFYGPLLEGSHFFQPPNLIFFPTPQNLFFSTPHNPLFLTPLFWAASRLLITMSSASPTKSWCPCKDARYVNMREQIDKKAVQKRAEKYRA